MQQDLAVLSRFIRLPQGVEDAKWETITLGEAGGIGPNDWVLVAVLRFKPEALQAVLSASSPKRKGETPSLDQSLLFDWYPNTVRSELTAIDGKSFRFEKTSYQPDQFAQSPLLNGYFVPVSKEEIFLFLQTS